MLLSWFWKKKKALIPSALRSLPMNAKCDLEVLFYTYKVVHVFCTVLFLIYLA